MRWRTRGFLAAGAVATLATGIFTGVRRAERRRAQALAESTARLGLVFARRDDVAVSPVVLRLPLFTRSWLKKGRVGVVRNVAHGVVGDRWVLTFDYDFYPGGPRPSFTVVAIPWRGVMLPELQLQARHGMPATPRLRAPAYVLDGASPRRAYVLRVGDEAAAGRLRDSLLVAFLREQPAPLCVEAAGEWVIVYRPRIRAAELDDLVGRALDVGRLAAGTFVSHAP
ncbi:MAG TPA: hypothetical protein VLF19_08760 [Methylomirabilota bacterium]|nr:hypothetical protein [Methylomirabilota bacterium]